VDRNSLSAEHGEPARLRVFVSYRREDTSGHAGRLYDALAARFEPENVFIDVDTIAPGSDFAESIDRAVTSCDVVIALIGRAWITAADAQGRPRLDQPDDFVRLELESALSHDIVVIPTCVQGAAIPPQEALPPALGPLTRRQAVELRDTAWRDDVERLIRRLEEIANEKTGRRHIEKAVTPPARRFDWHTRKGVLAAAAALLTLSAIAAGAVLALTGTGSGTGATLSNADRRLVSLVPPATRPSCTSIDHREKSARASIECETGSLTVDYHLFPTSLVMNDWYALTREDKGIAPRSGSCTRTSFRGESSYTVAGRTIGRYFCFLDSQRKPVLVTTDLRDGVGAMFSFYSGSGKRAIDSLLRQWRCCLLLQP